MALILCQECGRDVSDMALFCPGCGWPVREILGKLSGQSSHVRFHFNPLLRPGKLLWLLGMALIYLGVGLDGDPAFLGADLQVMGKQLVLEPIWFLGPGLLFVVWASFRGWFWGCGQCGGFLPERKTTRCPSCLLALTPRTLTRETPPSLE